MCIVVPAYTISMVVLAALRSKQDNGEETSPMRRYSFTPSRSLPVSTLGLSSLGIGVGRRRLSRAMTGNAARWSCREEDRLGYSGAGPVTGRHSRGPAG